MQLPELFEEKMKGLLGAEYEDFLAGYEKERHQALRVNPAKISAEEFARISPFTLEPVPWAKNGFYSQRIGLKQDERILKGREAIRQKHLFYDQGPMGKIVIRIENLSFQHQ